MIPAWGGIFAERVAGSLSAEDAEFLDMLKSIPETADPVFEKGLDEGEDDEDS